MNHRGDADESEPEYMSVENMSPAERFVAVWTCSRNAYVRAGLLDPDAPMRRDLVTTRRLQDD